MNKKSLLLFFIIACLGFSCLPFILFGNNSIITIHDNLDHIVPYFKMYHDNNLFFTFDGQTKGFYGMSTLYYGHVPFDIDSLLYYFFSDFIAYTLHYYISVLLGFFSTYILMKKLCKLPSVLSSLVAVCFSILPSAPDMSIAANTLPLIIFIFVKITAKKSKKISPKIFLLMLFPVFSSFTKIGIYVLGFWLIASIILTIKDKMINPNLFIGFFVLCIGYILVELRLFYMMFVVKEPLNRSIFDIHPYEIIQKLKMFLVSFKGYAGSGHYHATSLQRKIVLPTVGIVSLLLLVKMFVLIKETVGNMVDRVKKVLLQTDNKIKLLFILEFLVFVFSGIAALYDSGLMDEFIKKHIPILAGFNWGRVWIFNRALWYIIFALCVNCILQIDTITFIFHKKSERIVIPSILPKVVSFMVIGLQFIYIACSPVLYNDQIKIWFNEVFIKTGITKKILPQKEFSGFISYKEFFAEDLFSEIKEDILYSDEKVVAVGYHPSVLMYNGFNCIDGYNNSYPLSYMKKFRTLIAPELEVNEEARHYYDTWGGRMYLYNSELSYTPTRNKNTSPVKLNIDVDVFKNEFKGTYILSRAEITNTETLGLNLVRRYCKEESIYTIYLYKIK